MTAHDLINAIFEGGGALFLCLNVRRLWRDRSVKGVSLLTTSWWTAWGFWNVYFYSAVNTPLSFYAGIAVMLVNAVWLGLAVYFARAEKRKPKVHSLTVTIAGGEVIPRRTCTTHAYLEGARGTPTPGCPACLPTCACPVCWERQGCP